MEQPEFEKWIFLIITIGGALSVAEFLVIGLVIGGGSLVGFQSGMAAGVGTMIVSVILVWITTVILKPVPSLKAQD